MILAYQFKIVKNKSNRKKFGTKRANMSMVMNKGVKMHCKAVTANLFAVLGLLVEPSTAISKPNFFLETSL